MRKLNLTTRRLLGAAAVGALVIAGSTVVAGNAQAAAAAVTITPGSGSAAGGDTLVIKGKGFMDDDNAAVVKSAIFSTAVCADGTPSSAAGYLNATSGLSVTSATKATLKIPALALTAGTWYLCLFDSAVGVSGTAVGQAKYVTGAAPAITHVNGTADTGAATVDASSLGGKILTLTGTDFTKKSVVSIDGMNATKTTYVSATKVTAILPAHAPGTGYAVKVTTEYGSDVTSNVTVDYKGVVKVSPTTGPASTINAVELMGTGFNSYDFAGTAAGDHVVVFVPAGTTLTAGTTTIASLNPCTNVEVESDTLLSCRTPNNLVGAYSVLIVTRHATTTAYAAKSTEVARVATYTASNL